MAPNGIFLNCTDQNDATGRIPREPSQKAVIGWAPIHQLFLC